MTEMKTMTEVKESKELNVGEKLNVGVDVSKDSLDVAFWDADRDAAIFQGKFANDQKGFQTIAQKIGHRRREIEDTVETSETVSVIIVMEPTGGYEQPFARFAIQSQWQVSLPNPYHVKQWAGSMGIRAKTDRHDARTLAQSDGEGDSRSLVAYVGLDPQPHESGTSIRRRASISRQGNREFRSRLYMSALGGIKGDNPLRVFYKRLVGRGKPKKVALVASARKVLVWSWAVYRTNTPFDATRFQIAQ